MNNKNDNSAKISRRRMLTSSLTAGGGLLGLLAAPKGLAQTAAAMCGITPAQIEGPFYPVKPQPDTDWDLTQVNGKIGTPLGQIIFIVGKVQDENCNPIEGALVEIWQACASGKYNHPNDPNTAALDPNFQYWGKAVTDKQGQYKFKTVVPGAYPADVGWIRPPHVHYKVHKLGFHELTTQMYFAGNKFNAQDKILLNIPANERQKVIVNFKIAPGQIPLGEFNLNLKRVR